MKVKLPRGLIGVVLAWVVVYALFAVLKPKTFLDVSNLELLMRQSMIVGIAAIGMTYVIMTGGIDLSTGSVISLTTVVMALCLKSNPDPILALAAALGTGLLCGFINGGFISRLQVGPFIVTLASMLAFRGAATGLSNESTVSSVPETWIQRLSSALAPGEKWQIIPLGAWVWVVLLGISSWALRYTSFGRHVVAVGSNENTARLCGIRPERVKWGVYCIAGGFAGLAGALQFARSTIGDPSAASGIELQVIAAVVIGGASLSGGEGSLVGAAFGALIMATINMGCTQVGIPNWIQEVVTGLIILAAVGLDRWRLARSAVA